MFSTPPLTVVVPEKALDPAKICVPAPDLMRLMASLLPLSLMVPLKVVLPDEGLTVRESGMVLELLVTVPPLPPLSERALTV